MSGNEQLPYARKFGHALAKLAKNFHVYGIYLELQYHVGVNVHTTNATHLLSSGYGLE